MARSREALNQAPPNTLDASRAAGVTQERLLAQIMYYLRAEEKGFLETVHQYSQLMSAPCGAVAVMCRAISGMIRW